MFELGALKSDVLKSGLLKSEVLKLEALKSEVLRFKVLKSEVLKFEVLNDEVSTSEVFVRGITEVLLLLENEVLGLVFIIDLIGAFDLETG